VGHSPHRSPSRVGGDGGVCGVGRGSYHSKPTAVGRGRHLTVTKTTRVGRGSHYSPPRAGGMGRAHHRVGGMEFPPEKIY
jgi:hypothetical protein